MAGVVVHTYNPSTQKAEVESSRVQDQAGAVATHM
jgi:hypothetical protein